jgi:hypothetical protein
VLVRAKAAAERTIAVTVAFFIWLTLDVGGVVYLSAGCWRRERGVSILGGFCEDLLSWSSINIKICVDSRF